MCLTDEECVRQSLDGHVEAFRNLVVRYEASLQRYLFGKLGNQVEATEIAQETMVRAFVALNKLKKPSAFYSWLIGIADRVVREAARNRQREFAALSLSLAAGKNGDGAGARPVDCDDLKLNQAVADLPEAQRQVVSLRFYAGMSCREIGHCLDIPVGTVTSRLSRAYTMLRHALQDSHHDHQRLEVGP